MQSEDKPIRAHWGLAAIYATSVLARIKVISLIPVIAYQVLGTAQKVSELYFIASLFGIAAVWHCRICHSDIPRCSATCGISCGQIRS